MNWLIEIQGSNFFDRKVRKALYTNFQIFAYFGYVFLEDFSVIYPLQNKHLSRLISYRHLSFIKFCP